MKFIIWPIEPLSPPENLSCQGKLFKCKPGLRVLSMVSFKGNKTVIHFIHEFFFFVYLRFFLLEFIENMHEIIICPELDLNFSNM